MDLKKEKLLKLRNSTGSSSTGQTDSGSVQYLRNTIESRRSRSNRSSTVSCSSSTSLALTLDSDLNDSVFYEPSYPMASASHDSVHYLMPKVKSNSVSEHLNDARYLFRNEFFPPIHLDSPDIEDFAETIIKSMEKKQLFKSDLNKQKDAFRLSSDELRQQWSRRFHEKLDPQINMDYFKPNGKPRLSKNALEYERKRVERLSLKEYEHMMQLPPKLKNMSKSMETLKLYNHAKLFLNRKKRAKKPGHVTFDLPSVRITVKTADVSDSDPKPGPNEKALIYNLKLNQEELERLDLRDEHKREAKCLYFHPKTNSFSNSLLSHR